MKEKNNQKRNNTQKNGIPKFPNAINLNRKISSQNSIVGNEEENENKGNEESSNPKKSKFNSNNENLLFIKLEKQRSRSKADSNYALNINNNENNLKLLSLSKRNTNKVYEQGEVNINNCNTNVKDENNQKKENLVSKIKIKRASIYCCFLFIRKRKTIENALLDEGMNIIRENLDIFNLFKKMFTSEKIHEKLIKQEIFEMSEECKVKLLSINNKKHKL